MNANTETAIEISKMNKKLESLTSYIESMGFPKAGVKMLGRQEASSSDQLNDSGGFNDMNEGQEQKEVQAMGFQGQGNNPYSNANNNNNTLNHNLGTKKEETIKVDIVKERLKVDTHKEETNGEEINGSFLIPISVGDSDLLRGVLDLGASINMMHLSIYMKLGLEGLKPTKMKLLLADQTSRTPQGELNDVLILAGGVIIPTDFMVLTVEDKSNDNGKWQVVLGRPFMATA
ncbi:hypothetical protein LWI29_013653 [Acer saccharum]|uniref:Uncharacterized protein n=1 Tax=Acer saccharum TaxID=4024 RepID=A0AA39SNP9_ACESA|nr:hypothetical protein LWI29_013653 [Acer saccharum]